MTSRNALIAVSLVFLALAALPFVTSQLDADWFLTVATRMMILALAALALDLILGFGGLVAFGQAAFIGIGAYAVGILAYHGIEEALISFPVAILASALFAALTGLIALKTRGVYFIMITLAFGQMAYFTATSLSAYGGDDGLTIWTRNTLAGTEILADRTIFYAFVLACLLLAFLLCRQIINSPFGRIILGTRESERRMISLGADPVRYRLAVYAISGALTGLAGALLANHAEFVSPAYMTWQRSGELIVMVILGGVGTLYGAILGALSFIVLEEALSHITLHWRVIFGPLLIIVLLVAPRGLAGLIEGRRK